MSWVTTTGHAGGLSLVRYGRFAARALRNYRRERKLFTKKIIYRYIYEYDRV